MGRLSSLIYKRTIKVIVIKRCVLRKTVPIKVLHIIKDFNLGGAQAVILGYLAHCQSDPDLIMRAVSVETRKESIFDKVASEQKFDVVYLDFSPNTSSVPGVRPLLNWIKQVRLIDKAIQDFRPDIVHTHVTPILAYALLPILRHHVRGRVHTLHSDPYAIAEKSAFFARLAFRFCRVMPVCVTEEQAEKAVRRYGLSQYRVIKNGIDLERYQIAETKDAIRASLDIPADAFVVGCVGRLHAVKNHRFLLEVFQEITRIQPHSVLLIVGDGEERGNILKKAEELRLLPRLRLLGDRPDIARIYKAMDIFILPSKHESSSIATVEAQLAGVRCLISTGIPRSVIISAHVARMPITASPQAWCQVAMQPDIHEEVYQDRDVFSIIRTLANLKQLYFDVERQSKPAVR